MQTTHLAYVQFSLNLLRFTKAFILGSGVGLKMWLGQSYNSSTKIYLQDRVHSLPYLFPQVILHLVLFFFSAYTSFGGMLYVFVYTHVYTLACAFGRQSSTANILLNCAPNRFWRQGLSLNLDLTNSARLGSQRLLGSVCPGIHLGNSY